MIYKEKILDQIVKDFFRTGIIRDNDVLIVALSGGMDSMALMDAFYKLQSELDYELLALHVHHGIRGLEADRDLKFVKDYCKSMNVKLIMSKVNAKEYAKKNNMTLEEAARKLRYDAFDKSWKAISSKNTKSNVYILIAHHEKDQVETIIHNLVRGTGIKGIAGIKKISGYFVRPLLDIKKDEIEKYVDDYDVPYVNDSTNDDINYTRNFIRKEIIDKLEKINNKASEHIVEFARQARALNDFIEDESKKKFDETIINIKKNSIILDIKKFNNNENILKTGIIRIVFSELISTLKDITKININDIIVLAEKEKGGHLDLPYNITVDKKRNNLIFTKNTKNLSMSRRKKK